MGKAGVIQQLNYLPVLYKNHKPCKHSPHLWAPYVLAERNESSHKACPQQKRVKAFHWMGELDLNGSTGLIPPLGVCVDGVRGKAAFESQFPTQRSDFLGLQTYEEASTLSWETEIAPQPAVR